MNMSAPVPRKIADLPLFSPREKGTDDHDHVEAQRAIGPMARDSAGIVHLFSQADLVTVLDDAVTRQIETEGLAMRGITDGPSWQFYENSLLTSNGARHRTRRGALARTFAFPLMRALRPEIRKTADALLVEAEATGGDIDFLGDVAGPLPARVIAEILGVPSADATEFATLVYSAIRILQARAPEIMAEADADLERLDAFVTDLIQKRRADPQEDFLTRFVRDADAAGTLDEIEIRAQIVMVIFGGSDTTRATLAMGLSRLLHHPDQWAMLCADPDTWKGPAVEEILRYDPVVAALGRISVCEFELGGVRIPKGRLLVPNLVGAMRDPLVYADPHRFDITRDDHPRHTPAFGAGPHRCLGEALARVQLEEALAAIAERWPNAQVVGDPPVLKGLMGTRGVTGLVIRPDPRD